MKNKIIIDTIRNTIKDSTFCYRNKEGQGFIEKAKCQCYLEGEISCDAYFEKIEFHGLFDKLDKQGLSRNEILNEIEKIFKWNETSWIQYNVKK